jgi:hypothetical protein
MVACLTCVALDKAIADDFEGCMAGHDRYKSHLTDLENARAQCDAEEQQLRNDPTLSEEELEMALQQQCPAKQVVCNQVAPESGHAACEAFLQSGFGDELQMAAAQEANGVLKSFYDECTAQ